jgi:hypothetical protein
VTAPASVPTPPAGHRSGSETRQRVKVIGVRLIPDEYAQVKAAADARGATPSGTEAAGLMSKWSTTRRESRARV